MPILKVRDSEGNLLELELSKNSVNKIKKDIYSIQINDSGELVIEYNNGEESNLGTVVGVDGLTPFINANGNWQIGDTDTGVKAVGTDGKDGEDGAPGVSGVYVGSGDMPEDCNVQIDPDGDVFDIKDIIDQTYDSESKNAQSGIAVAEAVEVPFVRLSSYEELLQYSFDQNKRYRIWVKSDITVGVSENTPEEVIIKAGMYIGLSYGVELWLFSYLRNSEDYQIVTDMDMCIAHKSTDQTYNPESENAQSGYAVAEALSNYQPIKSITLTTYDEIWENALEKKVFTFNTKGQNISEQDMLDMKAGSYFAVYDSGYGCVCCIGLSTPGLLYSIAKENDTYKLKIDNPIVVDSEFSDTSTNPLQNKIITLYFTEIGNILKNNAEKIEEHDTTLTTVVEALEGLGDEMPEYFVTREEFGDIDTALDSIIAIQEGYIGGASE